MALLQLQQALVQALMEGIRRSRGHPVQGDEGHQPPLPQRRSHRAMRTQAPPSCVRLKAMRDRPRGVASIVTGP